MAFMLVAGLMSSCSEGADCDEEFKSSVHDSQLTSPELAFANKMTTSGSEVVQVSWPVIKGAGGYKVTVTNVDDPANPVVVVADSIIDGTSFTFPKKEDTNYSVSVLTLGNEALRNTGATEPTVVAYSTMVAGQIIPAGTADIVAWINEHMIDTDDEQAFELEAGATYTLDKPLEFGTKKITFRGNKVNRPTLVISGKSYISTVTGLKVKWINFDCTAQTPKGASNDVYGIIQMPDEPPVTSENPNANLKAYYNPETILIKDCMFKNVHCCLFAIGKNAWGIEDFRIDNSIVQMDNDGTYWADAACISGFSNGYYKGTQNSWIGAIKSINLKNSTFYNIKKNSKNRFVRWSNKDIKRVVPTALNDGSFTMSDCTISKIMTDKEFGNNTPNTKEYVISFNRVVTYDVWRLQKFIQGNCTWNVDMTTNTVWGVSQSVDGTDKGKIATEEDPGFTEEMVTKELDLTQPNGGVNFKATGAISSTIGDPRWF